MHIKGTEDKGTTPGTRKDPVEYLFSLRVYAVVYKVWGRSGVSLLIFWRIIKCLGGSGTESSAVLRTSFSFFSR